MKISYPFNAIAFIAKSNDDIALKVMTSRPDQCINQVHSASILAREQSDTNTGAIMGLSTYSLSQLLISTFFMTDKHAREGIALNRRSTLNGNEIILDGSGMVFGDDGRIQNHEELGDLQPGHIGSIGDALGKRLVYRFQPDLQSTIGSFDRSVLHERFGQRECRFAGAMT